MMKILYTSVIKTYSIITTLTANRLIKFEFVVVFTPIQNSIEKLKKKK